MKLVRVVDTSGDGLYPIEGVRTEEREDDIYILVCL
jgi:hypothetical protein